VANIELAIVLAAGDGTRMKSNTAKVLHSIAGRTIIEHVIKSIEPLNAKSLTVVVGAHHEEVIAHLAQISPTAKSVFQASRNGTGGAVQLALADHKGNGTALILAGDTPLLTTHTLSEFIQAHIASKNKASVLTALLPDPAGYGRVVRGDHNTVAKIVEQKDASEIEQEIDEINTGVYLFELATLRDFAEKLQTNNSQKELYLTDVIGLMTAAGSEVTAVLSNDYTETLGINDRSQLAECVALMRDRINYEHMINGVTMIDPTTTWIDADVKIEKDVTIYPATAIAGKSTISSGAVIGPRSTLVNCQVAANASVIESFATDSKIGESANVGPYSYLRAGTLLSDNAKIGAYVETKNSTIGKGSKVPHLSYVGDAQIGEGTNIGAATIFVNYDGENKHQTKVGNQVRIGSDTMLVAPVSIGDGAYTAAGSVINEDVPAGAIGIGRARQTNILGWVLRKRKGSKSADAAKNAGASE
jgi:bifunctional UDP-N-acetylglucosamine pyrophosphorylase / glucosamine-1-phosphate N-acetyltransferase